MAIQFAKATKKSSRLRMALVGPSGSGKSYTALSIASNLRPGGKVAALDTERGSLSKYADQFEFDVLEMESFSPQAYIEAIKAADNAGYDVLIIDSLSHAWSGKDGALEMVDKAARRSQSGNSFTAWRDVTPQHNAMVEAILQSRCDVIVTMRTKTHYDMQEDSRGRKVPVKIGLQPIQRDGIEYEFDVVGDMTLDHTLLVTKSRCRALSDQIILNPGKEVADTLRAWLTDGAPAEEPTSAPPEYPEHVTAAKERFAELSAMTGTNINDLKGIWRDLAKKNGVPINPVQIEPAQFEAMLAALKLAVLAAPESAATTKNTNTNEGATV